VYLQFEVDCDHGAFFWLSLDEAVLTRAEGVIVSAPPSTFLRAGDALHLAAAAEHKCGLIYSHDRHLLAAASLFGIEARDVIPA
jgi:predicted nucleic acid-binding protein